MTNAIIINHKKDSEKVTIKISKELIESLSEFK
jgi:hypothetical protein